MSKQITGNTGMYYVCYRLSEMGFNVMPTSRNAMGIDIVAYDAQWDFTTIQVKSFSGKYAIPLGKSIDHLAGEWWCIVYPNKAGGRDIYVLTLDEIKGYADQDGKNFNWWVNAPRFWGDERYLNRLDRIVCGNRGDGNGGRA